MSCNCYFRRIINCFSVKICKLFCTCRFFFSQLKCRMLKKILLGYKNIFSNIFQVLLLLCACFAIGFAFVFPLWLLASKNSSIYSIFVVVFATIILLFFLIKKILKSGIKAFLIFCLKFLVIFSGVFASIKLVLIGKMIFSIPVLLLTVFLWGFLSFAIKPKNGLKS